ncbi:MAG: hypothetical protein PHT94_00950 [Candidatus Nanoarchaeia archaeon]|nr:hypothetical protein [Candidatus Nanoarchaeia archaeon]
MTIKINGIKNFAVHLTDTEQNIYTCSVNKAAKITHIQASNLTNEDVPLSINLKKGENSFYFVKDLNIPANASAKPLGDLVGAIIMENDILQALSNGNDKVDLILSLTEYDII